jgi:hypothetical protein
MHFQGKKKKERIHYVLFSILQSDWVEETRIE